MPDLSFIAPTKRRKMTSARAARIFLREQGRCYLCTRKLRVGADKYEIEHPEPLALGGSDNDADLRVVCIDCHKAKTKQDAKSKAKRDRIITAGWAEKARGKAIPGRPFPKRTHKYSAARGRTVPVNTGE